MTSLKRTVRQLKITSNPTDISGQLSKKKDIFYKFKLSRSSNLNVSVGELAANTNVDVQLLNKKRKVLSRSANPGNASEFISTSLKQGEYLVRVLKRSKAKASYRLKISTGETALNLESQLLAAQRGQDTALRIKATNGQNADQIRYTVTQLPRNGVLRLNGKPLGVGSGFTQADIDLGRINYRSNSPGITVLGNGTQPIVSGYNVTWMGAGGADGGADNEIFFFDGTTTRQLTQNAIDDKILGIDGSHVVWSSQVGAADRQGKATYELYDFDGISTRRLTNNAANEDFVGVDGANLFWTSPVGAADIYGQPSYEVFYANAGGARQLTSNGVSEVINDFDGATAVWEAAIGPADTSGRATSEIFYFDGNGVRQLTSNAVNDQSPHVSGGRVAWSSKVGAALNGAATSEIFLFDGAATRQITSNAVDDVMSEIEGNTLIWMGRSGAMGSMGLRAFQLYRYDGATIQRVTANAGDENAVDIDGANLLWMGAGQAGVYGQSTSDLFFSNGVTTTQLTRNASDEVPAGVVGSKAVWYGQTGAADGQGVATRELFYFDGASVKQLTADSKNDDLPSFSDTTLAWRSTDGGSSQILKYDLADYFSYRVSAEGSQTAEQVLQIQYV